MGHFLIGGVKILMVLQAQATIAGTVRSSESEQPVAGVAVSLSDLGRATLTDSAGHYVFRDVLAGPRHIVIRALGFSPRTVHALVPLSGSLQINLALNPVATQLPALVVRHSVITRAFAATNQLSSNRQSSIAAIRNDPMRVEPDVLLSLAGGDVIAKPESPNGLHIRGGASDQVAYTLDGVPVFSPYHAGGTFSSWNPDAIAAIALSSSMPSPGELASLSGTIAATTRTPAERLEARGSFSTTHAAFTLDGPLGFANAGLLVSVRSGFPNITSPRHEPSYIRGETGDNIVKIVLPVFSGQLHVLSYGSGDEMSTSAKVEGAANAPTGRQNDFAWSSQTYGVEWTRAVSAVQLRALGWSASSSARSAWLVSNAPLSMRSSRHDAGVLVSASWVAGRLRTVTGVRIERSLSAYRIDSNNNAPSQQSANNAENTAIENTAEAAIDTAIAARTMTATVFADQEWTLTHGLTLRDATTVAAYQRKLFVAPRMSLQWKPLSQVTVTGSFARLYQYAQSMRNEESVAANIFPADLFMGASTGGVPVARSDQYDLGADYHPWGGLHIGASVYQRHLHGIAMVAPRNGEPFAVRGFLVGASASRGLVFDASISGARFAIQSSYGYQKVTSSYGGSTYTPDFGATHSIDGGAIIFPTPTLSIRFGVSAQAGRRTTQVIGPFEWEACNLRDRGCEFSGTPRVATETLGGLKLPFYARADLGIRKHWHVDIGPRNIELAIFGSATNVFGRRNVLTMASGAAANALSPVEMRPFAPLVIGFEWRF